MTTSNEGLDLIRRHEGLRLTAYVCPAGVLTIGYGHTRGVTKGMTITQEIAELLLKEDIAPTERAINALGKNLRQGQFDALVSFIFNLGIGNFNVSTLKKRIMNGEADEKIADEFRKWTKSKGKVLPGLVKRREEEATLWMK